MFKTGEGIDQVDELELSAIVKLVHYLEEVFNDEDSATSNNVLKTN